MSSNNPSDSSCGSVGAGVTASDAYYPATNDWGTTMSYLTSRMKPSHDVAILSPAERRKILHQFLPKCVADAYDRSSTSDDGQFIPHDELIHALQTVPHLVLEETPTCRYFVQLCGSEISQDKEIIHIVARKLATYWTIRKYFYRERAFLPMVQTSSSTGVVGAFSEEDMEWFNLGYGVVLPPTTDPYKHRSVVVSNYQVLPSCHQAVPKYANIKIRCSIYIMHLVMANPATQTEGVLLLQFLQVKPCLYYARWCYWIIGHALPIKDWTVHSLLVPSKIETHSVMSFVVSLSKLVVASMKSFLVGAQFHFGYSDAACIQRLANSVGLNKDNIAPFMAGTDSWSCDAFKIWQEKQMKVEEKKYKTTINKTVKGRQKESKGERSRELDAARCRKKRARARAFQERLMDDVHDLQIQNRKLKEENSRLGKLLQYAEGELIVLDGLEDEAHEKDAMGEVSRRSSFLSPSDVDEARNESASEHPHDWAFPADADDLIPE